MTAEQYCRESAEDLFQRRQGQADENFWQEPEVQEELGIRKRFIKRVIAQFLEVYML